MHPLVNPLRDEIGVQKQGMSGQEKDRMMHSNPAEDFAVVTGYVCVWVCECVCELC